MLPFLGLHGRFTHLSLEQKTMRTGIVEAGRGQEGGHPDFGGAAALLCTIPIPSSHCTVPPLHRTIVECRSFGQTINSMHPVLDFPGNDFNSKTI